CTTGEQSDHEYQPGCCATLIVHSSAEPAWRQQKLPFCFRQSQQQRFAGDPLQPQLWAAATGNDGLWWAWWRGASTTPAAATEPQERKRALVAEHQRKY